MEARSRIELFEEMSDCMVQEDIDAGTREMMARVCAFFHASKSGLCTMEEGETLKLLAFHGSEEEAWSDEIVELIWTSMAGEGKTSQCFWVENRYAVYPFDFSGKFRGLFFLENPQVDLCGRKMQETLREICRNIVIATHHRELVQQLREREEELQYVCNALLDIREEEAKRIALELHDGIGQSLTSMLLFLKLCQREPMGERLAEILEKLRMLVGQTLNDTRRIVRHMRPKELEELGLVQALYWYFSEYRKKMPQLNLEYSITASGLTLSQEVETALYRAVTEALTNVARHAQASRVSFAMMRLDEKLVIQIVDDGVGMDVQSAKRKGMGLLGMQERIRKIDGAFSVESVPGKGTRIEIVLSLAENEPETGERT